MAESFDNESGPKTVLTVLSITHLSIILYQRVTRPIILRFPLTLWEELENGDMETSFVFVLILFWENSYFLLAFWEGFQLVGLLVAD